MILSSRFCQMLKAIYCPNIIFSLLFLFQLSSSFLLDLAIVLEAHQYWLILESSFLKVTRLIVYLKIKG